MTSTHRIFVGQDPHKFHAAHMTVRPDGSKERLHGHTYQVRVAVDLRDVSFERFLDLGVLKSTLENVCAQLNEHLLLPEKNPHLEIIKHDERELEFLLCQQRYVVPSGDAILLPIDNVVVETLAVEVANRITSKMANALQTVGALGIEVEITEVRGQGGSYYSPLGQP